MSKLTALIRKYGLVKFVNEFLYYILIFIRSRLFIPRLTEYGPREALFFPIEVDFYTRYFDVCISVLKNSKKGALILDVGAGARGGISYFLQKLDYNIILLDVDRPHEKPHFAELVIADAKMMPFRDKCFDTVTSVATLEHIKSEQRSVFIKELKRMGDCLILHFPCEDVSHRYVGGFFDKLYQEFYINTFGEEEFRTAEHLNAIHPTINEMKIILPESRIFGRKNSKIWYKYMTFGNKPFIRFFTGFIYLLFWKKMDNKPPFYECLLISSQKN